MISQSNKLITTFITLLLLVLAFSALAYHLGQNFSSFTTLLTNQAVTLLSSYFLLGLGIGLPLFALATIFGWLQFILLMTGLISPHLAREGFFKVLETLFSRI